MSVAIRSAITVVLFFSFITLWIWAWRKGRNDGYADIAQLPLQDDEPRNLAAKVDSSAQVS